MRPNPLMATFTAMVAFLLSSLQPLSPAACGPRRRWPRRDAEVLVKIFIRRRGAEAGHADEHPVIAQPALPAEAAGGLDADPRRAAQHLRTIGFVLLGEQLPARQRHHGGGDALGGQRRARRHGDRHLRAGGDQRGLRAGRRPRPARSRRGRSGSRRCRCASSAAPGATAPAGSARRCGGSPAPSTRPSPSHRPGGRHAGAAWRAGWRGARSAGASGRPRRGRCESCVSTWMTRCAHDARRCGSPGACSR